uniref:Uncharacterized protein n=1 Tax=Anguilla anguilla TaxID=7936 RepID=A0A0E9R6F5_ANGAN
MLVETRIRLKPTFRPGFNQHLF